MCYSDIAMDSSICCISVLHLGAENVVEITNVTLELSYWVMAEHWSTGLAFCFNYVKLEIARSFELKTAD